MECPGIAAVAVEETGGRKTYQHTPNPVRLAGGTTDNETHAGFKRDRVEGKGNDLHRFAAIHAKFGSAHQRDVAMRCQPFVRFAPNHTIVHDEGGAPLKHEG
jgi:hypothetical protein